jgi:site-specific DNA-methyltransferase (adenine-specific)
LKVIDNVFVFNKEGLEFLSEIPDNSIDLILTDPPYITSRETGMDKWVDHVAEQDKEDAKNIKTEEEWLSYKTEDEWDMWMGNGNIPVEKRGKKLQQLKKNYLKYGSIYGKQFAVTTDYGDWDNEFTMEKLHLFMKHFYRILKDGGSCIVFFDIWKLSYLKEMMEEEKFKQPRFIEWIKTNPQPINSNRNYLTNCREIALSGVKKGSSTFNSKYDNGIYKHPLQGGKWRFHPTQKSLPLFEDLIKKHSNEGDTVLDCFLGSGTTAVAAAKNNRKFIGCEMSEEYFKKSLDRLKDQCYSDEEINKGD